MTPRVEGLLLAAGAGRRMGGPKALLADADGTSFVDVAVDRLTRAGCAAVTVVLGASAEEVRATLDPAHDERRRLVVADDWAEGMGASLRRGLADVADVGAATAVLVTLVDLPDVTASVMRRIVDSWVDGGSRADALVRASYDGVPGHPVLLGRHHWAPLIGTLAGDTGAQPYLRGRNVVEVSCEDLATGRDLDLPEDLR